MLRATFRKIGKFFTTPIQVLNQKAGEKLEDVADQLRQRIAENTPEGVSWGNNNLKSNWRIKRDGLRATIYNRKKYLGAVELGRKAAPVPIAPLRKWVIGKLGIQEPEATGVAIAISRKKARQRTPGKFFVKKTVDNNKSLMERLLANRISVELLRNLE